MLSESELEQKYKIVYVNKQRYYYQDLAERDHSLECTTPFSLDTGSKCFLETSWKQLLIEVISSYLKDDPSKKDALIKYRMFWNGKYPFSDKPGKYYNDVGEGVYLYCNQTALHACWILREILEIFGVELKKCQFIVHRTPFAEPFECRKFYAEKTRNTFKYYYTQLLKHSEDRAEQVLRNIDKLNKILPQFSKSYFNFYLIDNNTVYASYKLKFLDYLRYDLKADDKNVRLADKYLTILGDFYKTIR